MNKEIIRQWEERKGELRAWFTRTPQSQYCGYIDIVRALFTHVILGLDTSEITEIDNGDYQGTKLFLAHKEAYQPDASDYVVTHNYYGSCSGCDTLQGINGYEDGLPSESQVNDYMTLALHLVQKMEYLSAPSELSSCVAKLKEAQRWIPIEEKLPMEGKVVLTKVHCDDPSKINYQVATYIQSGNIWFTSVHHAIGLPECLETVDTYLPTHWRPIE